MGTCYSEPESDKVKRDKNHSRQKMFRFGVSFGRSDLSLEGHLQMGYHSKTIKNYGCIENRTDVLKGDVSSETAIPQDELGAATADLEIDRKRS